MRLAVHAVVMLTLVAFVVLIALSVRMRAIWIWPLAAAIGGSAFAATWAALEEAGAIRWIC